MRSWSLWATSLRFSAEESGRGLDAREPVAANDLGTCAPQKGILHFTYYVDFPSLIDVHAALQATSHLLEEHAG
jgi:hypothetical protein